MAMEFEAFDAEAFTGAARPWRFGGSRASAAWARDLILGLGLAVLLTMPIFMI
jgi:hypothetical protein